MQDLPKELQYKIASKLDVDSRRTLGIYTKLNVPPHITASIERALNIAKITVGNHLFVDLPILALATPKAKPTQKRYRLVKYFDKPSGDLIDEVVIHEKNITDLDYYMIWCVIDV